MLSRIKIALESIPVTRTEHSKPNLCSAIVFSLNIADSTESERSKNRKPGFDFKIPGANFGVHGEQC